MHEWVRDFCHAHYFVLNAKKCRYIISDQSPQDGRWLWSVDGQEKILPRPSSEHFRYLGLWLSMDLDWSKQIHLLNKQVMDWRWKSFAAKVDPAQLKASVIEYLLPRMEIGLQHADITEEMCKSWLSSIIFTVCQRGGNFSKKPINREAFCLLTDIPDIWSVRTPREQQSLLFC